MALVVGGGGGLSHLVLDSSQATTANSQRGKQCPLSFSLALTQRCRGCTMQERERLKLYVVLLSGARSKMGFATLFRQI